VLPHAQTARSSGLSPILNGRDPLADLTRSLDDQIRADAYRARGASPFQVPLPCPLLLTRAFAEWTGK
jgi:hypothetical protein